MDFIRLKSRAKINLSIDVLGKRQDGYHFVEMIMQTIDLYDIVKIKELDEDEIKVEVFDNILDAMESELRCHETLVAVSSNQE